MGLSIRSADRSRVEPRAGQKAPGALRGAGIVALGSHVPERVLTNADLERMVETSDEWIVTRTGISERRIVAEGEATSDLAVEAARRTLAGSGVENYVNSLSTSAYPDLAVISLVDGGQ